MVPIIIYNLVCFTASKLLPIYIKSEGCDDPGIHGCGYAVISVAGKDYSKHNRGYNIVVVDGRTGIYFVGLSFWPYRCMNHKIPHIFFPSILYCVCAANHYIIAEKCPYE